MSDRRNDENRRQIFDRGRLITESARADLRHLEDDVKYIGAGDAYQVLVRGQSEVYSEPCNSRREMRMSVSLCPDFGSHTRQTPGRELFSRVWQAPADEMP